MKKNKCLRCEWEWQSELERPATCPKCKSYYWDQKRVRNGNK